MIHVLGLLGTHVHIHEAYMRAGLLSSCSTKKLRTQLTFYGQGAILNGMNEKLLPDLTWVKPFAEQAIQLAAEATRSMHTLNDKINDLRDDKAAMIGGMWGGGITVAVVMLFLFVLNLSRRKQ